MIETVELKGKISSDNKIKGGNTVVSGPQGKDGLSAYEVAVKNGYIGTEEEWLINLKGDKGDQGEQGIQGEKGEQGEQGIQGIQGVPGKDFSIYKTYPSIAEMEADKDNVEEGNFVMIASNVEDVDNSKLYVKGSTDFVYLTDLSGATGMKGEQGPQGIQGEQGIPGPKGEQGEVSLEQLNILQTKTIKCLQEVETPTPVSGESINLSDSAEAKISELKISGNSKQETKEESYNLFIPTLKVNGTEIGNGYNTTTLDEDEFILTASGTDIYFGQITNKGDTYSNYKGVLYDVSNIDVIRILLTNSDFSKNYVTLYDENKVSLGFSQYNSSNFIVDTSSAKYLSLRIGVSTATSGNVYKTKVLMTSGAEGKTYERYGASPSPYYPSEVECCGDNGSINEVIDNGLETTDTNYKSQTYTIPTQQPFRAIGDIRDTFMKKNNKWYERHYIARKIFDGTNATWRAWTGTPPTGYSVFYTEKLRNIIDTNIPIKSNMLPYKTSPWNSGINAIGINPKPQEVYVSIESIHASTVDEWNEFLANNNLVVDYLSKEPIDIECTEEQSTILWDIEQNAKTYDKVTHIYSTDEVSPNIEITYKKDIETLFANTLIEEVG